MGWRGDDDNAKMAAATLLDNYREQWNDNFKHNKKIGKKIDNHIYNLSTGNIGKCIEILSTLNRAVMITPASKKANTYLAYRIKEYIRHISRRKPKPHLTIKHLRTIQQAYVDAISAHFVHQHLLVSTVLLEVFSNIQLISKTSLIPRSMRDEILEFKEEYEDEDDGEISFTDKKEKKIFEKKKKKEE